MGNRRRSRAVRDIWKGIPLSDNLETYYVVNEREVAKQEITSKIDELLESDYMSYLDAKIGLNLIKTFIKFMDEE